MLFDLITISVLKLKAMKRKAFSLLIQVLYLLGKSIQTEFCSEFQLDCGDMF